MLQEELSKIRNSPKTASVAERSQHMNLIRDELKRTERNSHFLGWDAPSVLFFRSLASRMTACDMENAKEREEIKILVAIAEARDKDETLCVRDHRQEMWHELLAAATLPKNRRTYKLWHYGANLTLVCFLEVSYVTSAWLWRTLRKRVSKRSVE